MQGLPKGSLTVLIVIALCAALVGGIAYWLGGGGTLSDMAKSDDPIEQLPAPLTADALDAYNVAITNPMNPIAVFTTNKGTIELELFADTMPITAGNFVKLAGEGFYNGVLFHRVIKDFMIQSGDPITKTAEVMRYGTGGPGYAIADEFIKGQYLTNVRGTIAMANSGPNSGGSQFFINLVDNTALDFDKPPLTSQHPVFGRVIKGMEVVDAIAQVKTTPTDLPVDKIVIEKVEIKTAATSTAAQQ